MPDTALVQHVSSAMNALNQTVCPGTVYSIPIPNPVLSGNCLILGITYGGTAPTSVADNINGTWPAATVSANAASYDSRIYVLPNAGAGQTTITVTFAASQDPFQFEVSEFSGIATSSTGAGSSSAADDTGTALACGAFTPTNNDATGGNLIWSYFCVSEMGTADWPTLISPGTSHTLLSAESAHVAAPDTPAGRTETYHATQYYLQTASASINPGITVTGDTGNTYNCLAVALKVADAGTSPAAGIRIKRIAYQSPFIYEANGETAIFQFPTTGNLIAIFANESDVISITGITDSQGNSYTKRQPAGAASPQCWHTANSTPDPNLVISVAIAAGSQQRYTLMMFDIEGAAASPYDTSAGVENTAAPDTTIFDDQPVLTPTTASGLSIALVSLGIGPCWGFHTGYPSGAVFDAPTYTGENDSDFLTNAAGLAHLYHTSTAAQHWNWTIQSDPNGGGMSVAVAFLPPDPDTYGTPRDHSGTKPFSSLWRPARA